MVGGRWGVESAIHGKVIRGNVCSNLPHLEHKPGEEGMSDNRALPGTASLSSIRSLYMCKLPSQKDYFCLQSFSCVVSFENHHFKISHMPKGIFWSVTLCYPPPASSPELIAFLTQWEEEKKMFFAFETLNQLKL